MRCRKFYPTIFIAEHPANSLHSTFVERFPPIREQQILVVKINFLRSGKFITLRKDKMLRNYQLCLDLHPDITKFISKWREYEHDLM